MQTTGRDGWRPDADRCFPGLSRGIDIDLDARGGVVCGEVDRRSCRFEVEIQEAEVSRQSQVWFEAGEAAQQSSLLMTLHRRRSSGGTASQWSGSDQLQQKNA